MSEVPEAGVESVDGGLVPSSPGWFVVNAREAQWVHSEQLGSAVLFEGEQKFPQIGINIQVLRPGEPNCMYHGEDCQEDFLVLSGECLVLIEGQERRLKQWDFVHCPPWTEHVFVGAGDGPCAILMLGARGVAADPENDVVYPRNDLALSHGAGVETTTPDPREAYARFGELTRGSYRDGDLPDLG